MTAVPSSRPAVVTDRFLERISARLQAGQPIRRALPEWGRIHVDRPLPFLCVYRRPVRRPDPGTERLVTTEASYLIASAASRLQGGLGELVAGVAHHMIEQFGAFLVFEIWAEEDGGTVHDPAVDGRPRPGFRILAPDGDGLSPLLSRFDTELARIRIGGLRAETEIRTAARVGPRHLVPLVSARPAAETGCFRLGLEVRPIYRAPGEGGVYPTVLRGLRRSLSLALRRIFYEFTRRHTTHRPEHFQVLGRTATVKAVWEVDRKLAEVADSFDFLLQVTPVNTERTWTDFKKGGYDADPRFRYRPLPVDPVLLKRRLYLAPMEKVEDPALALLLREKQDELDRQLTMLLDVDTPRFIHGSLQVFGGVEEDLRVAAEQILDRIPPRSRESNSTYLDGNAFAALAEQELAHYRKKWPRLDSRVQLRSDTAGGLMVSQGSLLIGADSRVPAARADALLQHEVGTHVLTYFNGRAQPFRQLYSGLAGYESLQEGLAVLAEYLVGGMSRPRLRLLAARVLAVHRMVEGAGFVDTFRFLADARGFERRTAFTIAMRTYRGGGLTKDAAYLRGLRQVLVYLGKGGALEPLFVGKIALEHVPMISELRWRNVLREPPLMPRYLERPDARRRLDALRAGASVLDLIDGRRK